MKTSATSILTAGLLAVLLLGCRPKTADAIPLSSSTNEIVVAVSPFEKDLASVLRIVTSFLIRQPNARIFFFDAWEGVQVTQFIIPELNYFSEDGVLARIEAPIGQLDAWLQLPPDAKLSGSGAMDLPRLFNRVSESLGHSPNRLIVIGSPLARFRIETNFDFTLPLRTPVIGHFKNSASPFYVQDWKAALARHDTIISYVYPNEDTSAWPAGFEESLRQFWGWFFAVRGADLVSFSPEILSGLRATNSPSKPREGLAALLNSASPSLEMINAKRLPEPPSLTPTIRTNSNPIPLPPAMELAQTNKRRNVQFVTLPTKTNDPSTYVEVENPRKFAPPPVQVVHVTNWLEHTRQTIRPEMGVVVGISSAGIATDVDIHVQPNEKSAEISYGTPRTSQGSYASHYDVDTQEQVKWVYFPSGVEVSKLKIWINYRKGWGPVAGKIFWLSKDSEAELPFSFECKKGGYQSLATDLFRNRSVHWKRCNLQDLVATKTPLTLSKPLGQSRSSGAAMASQREVVKQ